MAISPPPPFPPPTPVSTRAKVWFWAGIVVVVLVLIHLLSPVLTPFLMAAIFAYILNPGVEWLTRRRLPRWLASLMMVAFLIVLLVALILILVPLVQREMTQINQHLPEWMFRLNATVAPKLQEWFGIRVRFDLTTVRQYFSEQWKDGGDDLAANLFAWIKTGAGTAMALFGNLFLLPMVLFYLLLDWPAIMRRIEQTIPRRLYPRLMDAVREIDRLLSQFLRGQLLVMALLAVYYSAGLAIVGVEGAVPVGVLTGVLVFVPYIGFALGLALALLMGLLQFSSFYGILAVAAVYGLGQFIETFLLTPYLVGERIGVPPLAVIFALLAFGQLFGFFGVLLALPMSAILAVAIRRLHAWYLASPYYKG